MVYEVFCIMFFNIFVREKGRLYGFVYSLCYSIINFLCFIYYDLNVFFKVKLYGKLNFSVITLGKCLVFKVLVLRMDNGY